MKWEITSACLLISIFFFLQNSVRTDLTEEGANSTLSVAKINKLDSGEFSPLSTLMMIEKIFTYARSFFSLLGNYTCSIGPTHSFTTTVHVLNGKILFVFWISRFKWRQNKSFVTQKKSSFWNSRNEKIILCDVGRSYW